MKWARVAAPAWSTALLLSACGTSLDRGRLTGEIDAPFCWRGAFNLEPDYFAASPYRRQLNIRMQRGSDAYARSDGLAILVDDIDSVRKQLGTALEVGLSPDVTPLNTAPKPVTSPASLHATLYLEHTCKTENVALYALSEVQLGSAGECVGAAESRTMLTPANRCAATRAALPRGKSTMTFSSVFNGDTTSRDDAERLSHADMDLYFADPRESCPNSDGPPPPCRGHLRGDFHFLFDRAKPAQAFP